MSTVKSRCAILVSSILALGSVVSSPLRADFSATFQGDYAHAEIDHASSGDIWGGNGSARFALGPWGLNAQVDGGWHALSQNRVDVNDWDVNGSVFWLSDAGRLGGAVGYNHLDTSGFGSAHVTNYGGFAEWYAAPVITLGVKGGGASFSNGGGDGTHVGGEIVWYALPDLAGNGSVDYVTALGGHVTNYSVGAEWLVSETTPVSAFGGYTRSEFSGNGGANIWMAGLRFYTSSNGLSTLVDRQRTGNVGWASHIQNLGALLSF